MSTALQRYNCAVSNMEVTALELLRYAERFGSQIPDTHARVVRSRELLEAARMYAAMVRRVARLRA